MQKKRKMKPRKKVPRSLKAMKAPSIEPERNQRLVKYVAAGLLVVLGLTYSLHFLGHFVRPNPDFISFLQIGQQWLQFRIPYTMKRAPLFPLITVLAGQFFSTPDRYLFGTELYNALMLPTVMVLIYLIGREFIGRGAVWVALLACISPSMVHMSSQPLAELTLVALFAATCLCVRSHIKWAYFFAMLGSISRWDMAGLIPAVALVDLIRNRKWVNTIIMTALASIPFLLCMIITWTQLRGQSGGAHYIQVLAKDRTFELDADLRFYSSHICSFLNALMLQSSPSGQARSLEGLNSAVSIATSLLLAIAFIGGSIAAVIKKRWEMIVMLLAGIPYVMVHAIYPYRLLRFCVPTAWAWLIISAYGTIVFWQWFVGKQKPKFVIPVLQLTAAVIFILWAFKILATLDYVQRRYCPVIERLALISSLVTVVAFFGLQLIRGRKPSMKWLIIPAFLVLSVVSNAATTGLIMGDGQSNANFKRLGLWFLENAKDDDRMITTMPGWMPIYTGLPSERFEHMVNIRPLDAKDFPAFIQECRKRKITLIAWDSRLASRPNDLYYKEWGLDRIKILGSGKAKIGPCQLVHTLKGSPMIAVYRILSAPGS